MLEKDYMDEEFDVRPTETVGRKLDTIVRQRRQAQTTEYFEGSGASTEALLVEDPPGIGLGFILGKSEEFAKMKKRCYTGLLRCCISCCFGNLHNWNHLQTYQDPIRNLC